jgi:pilus assembly protein CpaB
MQLKSILIGILALVFGISAAVGVGLLVTNSAPTVAKPDVVSVLVAAVDIDRGQTLTAAHLSKHDWPKELVPEGAITNSEDAMDRTLTIPLLKGDLLLVGKLASQGAGRGMAAIIPSGMRAVTIQTPNVATGVAGFILPGNKVDVLLTMNNQGAMDHTGGGSTIVLLQNVEILAVDQRTDVPQDNKMDSKELRSVTLLVSPAESAKLDLGQNKGTLRLTLRNPTDKAIEVVDAVTLADLNLNSPGSVAEPIKPAVVAAAPVAAVVRKLPQIRTLRGVKPGLIPLPVLSGDPAISKGEPHESSIH